MGNSVVHVPKQGCGVPAQMNGVVAGQVARENGARDAGLLLEAESILNVVEEGEIEVLPNVHDQNEERDGGQQLPAGRVAQQSDEEAKRSTPFDVLRIQRCERRRNEPYSSGLKKGAKEHHPNQKA